MERRIQKKLLLVLAILGMNLLANAQVGIGTLLPSTSAQLDVMSANKGLLVPRVALLQTTNQSPVIGLITNSLLVYNTTSGSDVSPGFYYWEINKWVRLVAQSDPVIFNQTLTTLVYNSTTNELTYKDENGVSNILQLVGQTGPQGPTGLTGPQGIPGTNGNDGAPGPQGPIGLTGPQGVPGTNGNDGAPGPQGLTGLTGPQGIPGTNGNDGAPGPQGPIGLTGPQGVPGTNGNDGIAGPQGPIGLTGPQGVPGTNGNDGVAGSQGPIGLTGPQGVPGATGPQGGIGLILDGTNTSVSGEGTTANPYKINTPSIPATTVSNSSNANLLNTTVNDVTGADVNIINSNVLDSTNGNLTSTVNGVVSTNSVSVLISANNGLTVNNGTVQLGGGLLKPTTISTDIANTLAIKGLQTGSITNNIVVADTEGILKTITSATLVQEPWFDTVTNTGATLNTQNIYQMGNVAVGKNTIQTGAALDVKGAIRGGNTSATAIIGLNSIAVGDNLTASRTNSVAFGVGNVTLNNNTVVTGLNNTINNSGSAVGTAVFGSSNKVLSNGGGPNMENNSIFGLNNVMDTAGGGGSFQNNTIFGRNNVLGTLGGGYDMNNNALFGNNNKILQGTLNFESNNIAIFGENNLANGNNKFVIGKANINVNNALFEIGMGANETTRANALTVLNNGNFGIATIDPTNTLHVKSTANPVRLEGLQAGVAGTDNIVVADLSGVLKTVTSSALTANNWNILGNAGEVPGTNFLGTIDAVQLNFRVGNEHAGKIGVSQGIAGGDANTYLGLNAGLSDAGANNSTIFGNVAIGHEALKLNKGARNTAIGTLSLVANTTGFLNVSIGWNSLFNNSTGAANTAVGPHSLNLNTIGGSNAAFGSDALANNTTGSNNIGVGNQSGFINTTGTDNIFIGHLANASVNNLTNATAIGANATVGASNSMVLGGTGLNVIKVGIGNNIPGNALHVTPVSGADPVRFDGLNVGLPTNNIVVADATGVLKTISSSALTTNNWNILGNTGTNPVTNFLGTTDVQPLQFRINNTNAGQLSTTMTAFGYNALNPASTGNGNTAFGVNTLAVNTVGFSNSAVGFGALAKNSTGGGNTAFGSSALTNNVDGGANTAIGSVALSANVSGVSNVAVGNAAMSRNTTGSYNVGLGWQSLNSNLTGTYNTGIGYGAVSANTTGTWNTGLGANALQGNSIGTANTAIGYNALLKNVNGNNNTILGQGAFSENVSGNNNIAIGYLSGNLNTSGSNNILIGPSSKASSAIVSNEMNIGNTLYGTAINDVLGTGKIGINVMAPTNALHVTSTADPVRLQGLQAVGSLLASDNVVIADAIGVLRTVTPEILSNTPSDLRLKKDILTSTYGLNFISKLRPVTYKMKTGTTNLQSGFIAQEVESAAKEINYEFNGVVKPQTTADFYSLKYAEFVVPLVKAVQEQQSQIELYEAKIKNLEKNQQTQQKELAELKEMVNKLVAK